MQMMRLGKFIMSSYNEMVKLFVPDGCYCREMQGPVADLFVLCSAADKFYFCAVGA